MCRRFGISRKSFYKWKRRHVEHGEPVYATGRGRRTDRLEPRRARSSARFCICASTITSDLAELRHICIGSIASRSRRSSVHRILARHGMNRLPANQKHQPHGKRWQRYEKPQPGHRLQLDVKFLERIPGRDAGSISSRRSMIAPDSRPESVRRVQPAHGDRSSSTRCYADCRSACTWCRPITVPSSSPNSTGTSRPWTSGMSTSGLAPRASTEKWSARIGSMTRSSTNCSTRTASAMTSTYSTRSCVSGRTTTITIDPTEPWPGKPVRAAARKNES